MKKTNKNAKTIKFTKRQLIVFLAVQFLLILLFVCAFVQSKPVNVDKCTTEKIIVEGKEYSYIYREYVFRIFSSGKAFEFSKSGFLGEYTLEDLYEQINIGEEIKITYTKGYRLFGTYNMIVDAKTESDSYSSISSYNLSKQRANTAIIVIFSVLELAFVLLSALYSLMHRKELKKILQRSKKAQTS